MEEYEGQLRQLWKAANEIFTENIGLSQSYLRRMIRIAGENDICLGNSFYWNVCSCCGLQWLAGCTVTVRLWSYRKLRTATKTGKFIFMSHFMKAGSLTKRKERVHMNFVVYHCKGCQLYTVFEPGMEEKPDMEKKSDIPLRTRQALPITVQTRDDKRKLAQLQKILSKSKSPTGTDSDLNRFLKGLNPKK